MKAFPTFNHKNYFTLTHHFTLTHCFFFSEMLLYAILWLAVIVAANGESTGVLTETLSSHLGGGGNPNPPQPLSFPCSSGRSWMQWSVKHGTSMFFQISGRGNTLDLGCFSGWVWDLNPFGNPGYTISLTAMDTVPRATVDITKKLNMTYYGMSYTYTTPGMVPSSWVMTLTNNNMLWNLDFTLAVDASVYTTAPGCNTCATLGVSGFGCNVSCASHCFQCCQSDPSQCTVCAVGLALSPPACALACSSNCLMCDTMGGCIVCADPTKSGPSCSECRPPSCQRPDLSNCANPCINDGHILCDNCKKVSSKAASAVQLVNKAYATEAAAAAALLTLESYCALLIPFEGVGLACEGGIALGESGTAAIKWLASTVATNMAAAGFCAKIGICASEDLP